MALPFLSVPPQSQTEILVQPARQTTSDFTGFTQRINTIGEYWRGELTFAPRRNFDGEPGRRDSEYDQDRLASFLALLDSPQDDATDGTFWLQMRIYANPESANAGSMPVSRISNQVLELASPITSDAQRQGLAAGKAVQVCMTENINASIVSMISGFDFNDTTQICLSRPLPQEFLENGSLKIIWGVVRVRAFITNADAISGVMSEPGGIYQPAAIAWQEARGQILRDAAAVGAQATTLAAESGAPLTAESGLRLRRQVG